MSFVDSTVSKQTSRLDKHRGLLLLIVVAGASVLAGACGKSPPAPAVVSAVNANVSDIDVTEHVQTALSSSESLKGFDIQVVTLKGDVRLTGVLDTQTQIDEARRIARAAVGAHSLHDELSLKK